MKYLLDTCVLSEARKSRPSEKVVRWMTKHSNDDFFVSSVAIAEIKRGIDRLDESNPNKTALADWLDTEILVQFSRNILPFDATVARKWGEIMAVEDARGNPRPLLDAQIVATALVHGATIVTRNVKDMGFGGVKLMNPWNS